MIKNTLILMLLLLLFLSSCTKRSPTNPSKQDNSNIVNNNSTNNNTNNNVTVPKPPVEIPNPEPPPSIPVPEPPPPPPSIPEPPKRYETYYLENVNAKVQINVNNFWENNNQLDDIYRRLVSGKSIYKTYIGTYKSEKVFSFDYNLDIYKNGVAYKKFIKTILVKARNDGTPLFNGKYALGAVYQVLQRYGNSPDVGKLEILVLNHKNQIWVSVDRNKYSTFTRYDASKLNLNGDGYNPDNVYNLQYPIIGDLYSEPYDWILYTGR